MAGFYTSNSQSNKPAEIRELGDLGPKLLAMMPNAKREQGGEHHARVRLDDRDGDLAAAILLQKYGAHVVAYDLQYPNGGDLFQTQGKARYALTLDFDDRDVGEEALDFHDALFDKNGCLNQHRVAKLAPAFERKPPADYASLLEALRNGLVFDLQTRRNIKEPKHRLFARWNIEVYDFGEGLDLSSAAFFGEELISSLLEVAADFGLLSKADFRLPVTAFVFMLVLGGTTFAIRVEAEDRTGKAMAFEVYRKRPARPRWERAEAFSTINHVKPADEQEGEIFGYVIQCSSMLMAWEADAELMDVAPRESIGLAAINARRLRNHDPLVPPVRVIHLSSQKVVRRVVEGMKERASYQVGRHERLLPTREIVRIRNGKEERYHYRKGGERIIVNADKAPAKHIRPIHIPLTPSYVEVRA